MVVRLGLCGLRYLCGCAESEMLSCRADESSGYLSSLWRSKYLVRYGSGLVSTQGAICLSTSRDGSLLRSCSKLIPLFRNSK